MEKQILPESIEKQLVELGTQATKLVEEARGVVYLFTNSEVAKIVRGSLQVNPNWADKLRNARNRDTRKKAHKLLPQLNDSFGSLWSERLLVESLYDAVQFGIKQTTDLLQGKLNSDLQKLESWVNSMHGREKVLNYSVKELKELTTSIAPTRVEKQPGAIGGQDMAKTTENITQLVAKLTKTEDQDEKRALRKKLRALGHKGGLRKPKTAVKKPAAKPAAKSSKKVSHKKTVTASSLATSPIAGA